MCWTREYACSRLKSKKRVCADGHSSDDEEDEEASRECSKVSEGSPHDSVQSTPATPLGSVKSQAADEDGEELSDQDEVIKRTDRLYIDTLIDGVQDLYLNDKYLTELPGPSEAGGCAEWIVPVSWPPRVVSVTSLDTCLPLFIVSS